MACVNCKIDFEGAFCPTCGEKKDIDRITFGSLISSIFSGFVNMDKGFLFNIKNLTLHPQKTILQYVQGKRRYILNPISYAIVTISLYLFVESLIPKETGYEAKIPKSNFSKKFHNIGYNFAEFILPKMKFFWLSIILYLSVFSKLFFRRFNFFEHLAINSFIVGHATILAILSVAIFKWKVIFFNVLVFIYIIFLMYKVFKKEKDTFEIITISSFIVFFSYLFFITIPLAISIFIK